MPKLQVATKPSRATFLAIGAITCPFSSQISTPIPAEFSSFNMTPSKLIMRHELGGDFHLSLWGAQMTESWGFEGIVWMKPFKVANTSRMTWLIGYFLLLDLKSFFWYQMFQIVWPNRSKFLFVLITYCTNSPNRLKWEE